MTSIHDPYMPFNHNSQLSKLPQINRINLINYKSPKYSYQRTTSQKRLSKRKSSRKNSTRKGSTRKNSTRKGSTRKNSTRKNPQQKVLTRKNSTRKNPQQKDPIQKNLSSKNIPKINNKYSEQNIYYLESNCRIDWKQNKLLQKSNNRTKLITKYKQLIQDPFKLEDSCIDINNLDNNKNINLVYHTEKFKTYGFTYNLYNDNYINSNKIY